MVNNKNDCLVSPKIKRFNYIIEIPRAFVSLLKGMLVTIKYLINPWSVVTQQYPENRKTLKMFERYRSQLTMPHDEKGFHKCTACKICETNCPNASITVAQTKNVVTSKNELQYFQWRMDSCIFCNICVQVCPFGALSMGSNFETTVYDRRLLIYNLNRYSGAPASVLNKIEDPAERANLTTKILTYQGELPLAGFALDGAPKDALDSVTFNKGI